MTENMNTPFNMPVVPAYGMNGGNGGLFGENGCRIITTVLPLCRIRSMLFAMLMLLLGLLRSLTRLVIGSRPVRTSRRMHLNSIWLLLLVRPILFRIRIAVRAWAMATVLALVSLRNLIHSYLPKWCGFGRLSKWQEFC